MTLVRFRSPAAVGLVALAALACGGAPTGATPRAGAVPPALVHVQILAFNDFHGNLEAPTGSNGMVGGYSGDASK